MRKNNRPESLKRLQHIEKAIESVKKYTVNENVETFCANSLIHDAVLFQFSVIGEAINHVDTEYHEPKIIPYPVFALVPAWSGSGAGVVWQT